MSPGRTRVLFAAFLLIAGGVTTNALMLQTRPTAIASLPVKAMPAPPPAATVPARSETATPKLAEVPSEPSVRIAGLMTDSADGALIPHNPHAEGDPAVLRALQDELARRGYGPIVVTPKVGPQLRAAILAFEFDQNLPLTGEATEILLGRLSGRTALPRAPDPDARKVRSPEAERVIHTVQQSLTTLGFSTGRVDGRFGDETAAAIRAFETEQGLAPTGRISAPLFNRLAAAVGARAAR